MAAAFASGVWSAKRWADIDGESDSDIDWALTPLEPHTPSTCGTHSSDENNSVRAWYCDSDDQSVEEARLEQKTTEANMPMVLATIPMNLSINDGSSLQYEDQCAAPAAGFRKLRNRPITRAELLRSNAMPGIEDITTRMTPWSSSTNLPVESVCFDTCTDVGKDSCLQSSKRTNKASKNRRDRYKSLVHQLQVQMEEDPTMEFTTILPCLPYFISSDQKLLGKLEARLQNHRREQEQMLSQVCGA